MPEKTYDALIVGSGAAGAVAAQELTAQGLRVLMLEAGPKRVARDFQRRGPAPKNTINIRERAVATLQGQGIQARAMFFSRQMSHFYVNDHKSPYTTPKDAPFLWVRGHQEGGRTHVFGRVLYRWSDDDFKTATKAGRGLDWPVSYDEMAPFYGEVETSLQLHGNADGLSATPDSLCAAPSQMTAAEEAFKASVETRHPQKNVIAWRYVAPRADRMLAPLQEALDTGLLTIRHNAIAQSVLTDDGTRATGIAYLDQQNRQSHKVFADNIVLCASPIETVRLLWHSTSEHHPNGIGNTTDLLGRYFMDQVPVIGQGACARVKGSESFAPIDAFYEAIGGFFMMRDEVDVADRGEYAVQGSVGRQPVTDPNDPARFSFFAFGQMLPHADNRITLDPKKKDAFGMAVPHLRCKMHGYETQLAERIETEMLDLMREEDIDVEFVGSPLGLQEFGAGAFPDADPVSRLMFRKFFHKSMSMGAAIHESGGAIMGDDPSNSVLNKWGQVWDMPNLVVADASAFPSSGVTGTTLTVMANAKRVCRHLAMASNSSRS